jgi:hypothetical protein
MIEPEIPTHVERSQRVATPYSSPISQNPLLRKEVPVDIQTPSPSQRRPQYFRTQDGNAAWAAAEGLLPIHEGFTAPGYVPAQIVGGVTYTVRSPQARSPQTHQPIAQRASVGSQLFGSTWREHTRHFQQRSAAQGVTLQQLPTSQSPHLQQKMTPPDVRLRTPFLIY